jgi:hypothetical protein
MCKHEKTALMRGWLPLEGFRQVQLPEVIQLSPYLNALGQFQKPKCYFPTQKGYSNQYPSVKYPKSALPFSYKYES